MCQKTIMVHRPDINVMQFIHDLLAFFVYLLIPFAD